LSLELLANRTISVVWPSYGQDISSGASNTDDQGNKDDRNAMRSVAFVAVP